MRIGVTFPQIEFGNDTGALKEYIATVEGLGYTHLLAYDHVLSADTTNRPGWTGSYALKDPFHEVFVFFGYVAALTQRLELVTGVLILPQRQTALVAKQAAEVDVLSNGRFRLGIGVGWNEVEYEGLGESFAQRGVRSEEQMQLLRALWTNRSLTFDGTWDQVVEAGLNPLPVQQPIPDLDRWLCRSDAAPYRTVWRRLVSLATTGRRHGRHPGTTLDVYPRGGP